MRSVELYMANAEQHLNPIDWIPFISNFSGMIRVVAGMAQVVAGIAFAFLRGVFLCSPKAFKEEMVFSLHGLGNIFRGTIALFPGINLILAVHDYYFGRMNYRHEKMLQGVYPLMTAPRLVY